MLAAAGLLAAACGSGGGASDTPTARPTAPPATAAAAVVPTGFGSTLVRLTEPDGTVCERCLLVAATDTERARGLMGATSLGGYDGMVFRYDPPVSTSFWMKDTVLPLSIAFYDTAGAVLRTFDMEPCTADPCATYGPGAPFSAAVEVEQGRLADLGFTPTATLTVLDRPCEPAA